jgi:hypothetical protein
VTDVLFASDRYFQVWAYRVSKCELMLRSTLADGRRTRIDVLFSGVEWMALRSEYPDGITIRRIDLDQVPRPAGAGEFSRWAKGFSLGEGVSDLVVAGLVQWHEDDRTYDQPSYFGG